jgi:hypothetical protein
MRRPPRRLGALLVLLGLSGCWLSEGSFAQGRREPAPLFHAFLWGWDLPSETMQRLPIAVRRDVERRLAIRRTYRPRLVVRESDPVLEAIASKKQQLEVMLVSLTSVTAAAEATRYARESYMSYETEGDSGPLMGEASAAARYLLKHPATALAPALSVFALHRFRCAYEAAAFAQDRDVQTQAVTGYLSAWRRLQKSEDPLIRAMAREIDGAPYVFIETDVHPRAFK